MKLLTKTLFIFYFIVWLSAPMAIAHGVSLPEGCVSDSCTMEYSKSLEPLHIEEIGFQQIKHAKLYKIIDYQQGIVCYSTIVYDLISVHPLGTSISCVGEQ